MLVFFNPYHSPVREAGLAWPLSTSDGVETQRRTFTGHCMRMDTHLSCQATLSFSRPLGRGKEWLALGVVGGGLMENKAKGLWACG